MNPESKRLLWTINPYTRRWFAVAYASLLYPWAWLWRQFLRRTTFITITGSLGKSIAREILAETLASRYPTSRNARGDSRYGIPRAIRRTKPGHRYAVIEVNCSRPDWLDRTMRLVRPRLAVVTNIMPVHIDIFPNREQMAAEKVKTVRALSRDGVAILNGDDPLVMAMKSGCPGKIFTFGRSRELDLWADEISGRWPDRLSFMAHHEDTTCRVQTQLVGEHQLDGALAALAAALHCGFDLAAAASALASAPAPMERMTPVELPGGAVLLRDALINPLCKFEAALPVLANARAGRRIIVAGAVSDAGQGSSKSARLIGQRVATAADMAVFVGRECNVAARAAQNAGMPAETVHKFKKLRDATEFLRHELVKGDLVWLTSRLDAHLMRLHLAQIGTVECWREHCKLPHFCDPCPHLGFQPFADQSKSSE